MKRFILGLFFLLTLGGIFTSYWLYNQVFQINTLHTENRDLYIPTDSDFESLVNNLISNQIIENEASFRRIAKWMKFENVKPGKFELAPGLNNRALISRLRSGVQKPVNITISTARTFFDVASIVQQKIEADSVELVTAFFQEDWMSKHNLDKYSAISIIVPNTYQFNWNTSAYEFLDRMSLESDKFWDSNNRRLKLMQLDLTTSEVSTLASIVEKESIQIDERPTIAGVYLNRIKKGIHLQADPTVVFAVGDFSIQRVLNKHLKIDSPFNTYKYPGIPPGPICMPSISSIDAVLNAEEHDYIFFCAKPGYNGFHSFARTNAEHERNARLYRRWLNKEGIKG